MDHANIGYHVRRAEKECKKKRLHQNNDRVPVLFSHRDIFGLPLKLLLAWAKKLTILILCATGHTRWGGFVAWPKSVFIPFRNRIFPKQKVLIFFHYHFHKSHTHTHTEQHSCVQSSTYWRLYWGHDLHAFIQEPRTHCRHCSRSVKPTVIWWLDSHVFLQKNVHFWWLNICGIVFRCVGYLWNKVYTLYIAMYIIIIYIHVKKGG